MDKLYFCEGIKCENRISLIVEGESADTCKVGRCPPDENEGCPYSPEFVKGWYRGQKNTIERIDEGGAVKEAQNILGLQ